MGGDESNVAEGSALWMIDNNPGKDQGVLPIQALDFDELSSALKHLCILNTVPITPAPTGVPEFEMSTDQPSSSPTHPPVAEVGTPVPTADPTISPAPTFLLPDCYEGPKLVKKDSSDLTMCHYSPDMVQINDMNTEEVTIAINNVWTQDVLPTQMRVFIHTDGIDAISKGGEGFKCKDEDGTDIDIEGDNEFTLQCYQAGLDEPFFAVIDVVITDDFICATNDVPHPCNPDGLPILESCSWRIVIPCDYDQICTDPPTVAPSELPSDGPSMEPSSIPTAGPTASPSESHSFLPTDGPSLTPSLSPTEAHSFLPSLSPSLMIVTEPPI